MFMKKGELLILVFLLTMFLILNNVNAKIINCRNDMNCFVENSKDCNRSKVDFLQSVDFFGMNINVTTLMNIKEERDGRCKLYIQHKTLKFYFSDWVVEELVNEGNYSLREIKIMERQINKEAKKVIGTRGICKFEKQDLTDLLTNWNSGISLSTDFDKGECRGNIF